jgi:hypothetical protein
MTRKKTVPPLITVKLTGEANESALAQLEQHGCLVKKQRAYVYHITFPAGTVRRFYLRISHTDRYHLILPDGLILTELVTSHVSGESHALYIPERQEESTHADKQTFRDLYIKHEIHLASLAYAANVSPNSLYLMLRGQPVSQNEAVRVLAAISQSLEQEYTLETVHVELLPTRREMP